MEQVDQPQVEMWHASSARIRSNALVSAAPSMTFASTGSTCSHAGVPRMRGVGSQVVRRR